MKRLFCLMIVFLLLGCLVISADNQIKLGLESVVFTPEEARGIFGFAFLYTALIGGVIGGIVADNKPIRDVSFGASLWFLTVFLLDKSIE